MKKKGFTLIELLAVIVVLAIIALIATPIVMNVIKNASAGAAERSADNYIKAVDTLIATEKLDGTPLVDGQYTIGTDGKMTLGENSYEVEVSGTKPVGGTIKIENGRVVKDSSTIDYADHTVTYKDGKAEASEKKGLAIGSMYSIDPGDGVAKNFYVLEIDGDNVYLLMDRNIDNVKVDWCKNNVTDNACDADAAKEYLATTTSTWTNSEILEISLPTYNQIYVASGSNDTSTEDCYVDINGASWLYDNLDEQIYDVDPATAGLIWGYWLDTKYEHSVEKAWSVSTEGELYANYVAYTDGWPTGIRPVIKVSKDSLK